MDISQPQFPVSDPAPARSCETLEKKLIAWQKQNIDLACRQMQPLFMDINSVEQELKIRRGNRDTSAQDVKINAPEAANQCEIVAANFAKSLRGRGSPYRVEADNGELQARADTTKEIMDIQIDRKQCDSEAGLALRRFVRHKLSGLRLCVDYSEAVEAVRFQVPMQQADQVAAQDDEIRMIYADQEVALLEAPGLKAKRNYYFRALDMRNVALSDMRRKVNQPWTQPSIHERFLMTKDEMEENAFRNIESIGVANGGGQHHIENQSDYTLPLSHDPFRNSNFPDWEIWESWSSIPWMQWMKEIPQEEFPVFADKYGFQFSEFAIRQKWQMFHTGGTLLKVSPNWLRDKKDVPYRFCSYHAGDGEMAGGESFFDFIADLSQAVSDFLNLGKDGTFLKLYQSIIVDENAGWDASKVSDLWKKRGLVPLSLGLSKFDDKLLFFGDKVPADIGPISMNFIQFLKAMSNQFGAPDVIQGSGKEDTATLSIANQSRGQDKLDDPFYRWVTELYVPMLEMIRDLVFMNFDDAAWLSKVGEKGAVFAGPRKVTPMGITNRFKIIPTAQFDFASRQSKVQALLGAMNILARNPADPMLLKVFGLILEMNGWSHWEISDITGNYGKETTPEDELLTMLYNPDEEPRVLPGDDHAMCLKSAALALQDPRYAPLVQQYNFQEWMRKHFEMWQFQMQQQALMAQMMPQQPVMEQNGPPNQVPAPGNTAPNEISNARSGAQIQQLGPGKGPMSEAGITGRASIGQG